jgi:coenzyme F420-reducing hydrogenase alpha subunit
MAINKSSTKAELLDHLRDTHGEDMTNNTKEEILTRLSELDGVDYNKLGSAVKVKSTEEREVDAEARVVIRVSSEDKPEGNDDVFVSVNGVAFLIKRDRDVSVPKSILVALQNAKQTIYKQKDNGEMVITQVARYPVSVVSL